MANATERIKMVKAMEFIAAQINCEDYCIELWRSMGVADGDIQYGDLDVGPTDEAMLYPYFEDDEDFVELMRLFLYCMYKTYNGGGLYCDYVASR